MPVKSTLDIPNTIMEQLHCTMCNGYLSCGPVRVQSDGSCICGRCTPLNSDVPVYRVFALEAVLSKTSFPCRFNQRGCKAFVMFGQAVEHESNCLFRSFTCPSCMWEGSASEMLVHFKKTHAQLLMQNFEIKLQLDENSQGILMLIKNDTAFVVKYTYEVTKRIFAYDIRYCKNAVLNSFYKVQLFNGLDPDCSISFKMNKCNAYSESFYDLREASVLDLNNYLQNLDNPVCVAVKLTITQTGPCDQVLVDINSLKCAACHSYLIPPLYDLDNQTICSDCARRQHRCVPSKNKKIQKLVTDVNFPCRWRDCKFTCRSDQFKKHELTCTLRHYDCFFPSCQITFQLKVAIDHLQAHRAQYLTNGIVYKSNFAQPYGFKHIFTIKQNRIILIQHSMFDSGEMLTHRVALFSSEPTEASGSLDFEHQHCKLKSKPFAIVSDRNTDVNLNQLPPCYKNNDELTVTLNI